MGYNVEIEDGGGRMKKALPVGVENFENMVKSGYYYVDKTMFIKELLDMRGKVNLCRYQCLSASILD